jgi:hypothetical protein
MAFRSMAATLIAVLALPSHAQDIDLFAKLIKFYGFDCPSIQFVRSYGKDRYGEIAKVWCGQRDRRGDPIYFRVTEFGTPHARYRVESWRD